MTIPSASDIDTEIIKASNKYNYVERAIIKQFRSIESFEHFKYIIDNSGPNVLFLLDKYRTHHYNMYKQMMDSLKYDLEYIISVDLEKYIDTYLLKAIYKSIEDNNTTKFVVCKLEYNPYQNLYHNFLNTIEKYTHTKFKLKNKKFILKISDCTNVKVKHNIVDDTYIYNIYIHHKTLFNMLYRIIKKYETPKLQLVYKKGFLQPNRKIYFNIKK